MVKQLLLVDDSPTQVAIVSDLFRGLGKGINVRSVSSGSACLEELRRTQYAAVLLDYMLPDMNGLEVLSKIRQGGWTVPVVMVTGHGGEKVAVEAMKTGAADYITKNEDFLQVLPVVVQQVLENEDLKIRLAEVQKRLQQLSKISIDISLELKLDSLAQRLADGIRRLVHSQISMVLIRKLDSEEVEVVVSNGIRFDSPLENTKIEEWGLLSLLKTTKGPVMMVNPLSDSRYANTPPHEPQIRSVLIVPLSLHGKIIGGMLVANPVDRSDFGDEERDVLINLALHASTAIENARYVRQTELLAVTDSLTGLYNHREFQKRMDQEVERAKRYDRPLSIFMLDIDHFKSFNDTYGHQFGDGVLQTISGIMKKQIRTADVLARYGGEEFALILPETNPNDALLVAERIRLKIFETDFSAEKEMSVRVTMSIGVASLDDARDRMSLIAAADKALYIAKEAGRNRACLYSASFEGVASQEKASVEDMRTGLLKNLAAAVDAKSPYTKGHSEHVAQLTLELGKLLGLHEAEIEGLRQAGLFHNVGTVNISGRILNKQEPLSNEEQKVIRAHPIMAEMLLRQSPHLETIIPAVLYHHERYDGKGYPKGLKGEEIPFSARILGVTSAYQAMISDRPYRQRLSKEEAWAELRRNAGTQFDPDLVEKFIQLLDRLEK